MGDDKSYYIKLVTSNYEDLNSSKTNYCINCYGENHSLEDSIINLNNMYWINDKNGLTGGCKKCLVDAIIPGNYFINKNENEINKELSDIYKYAFTVNS